MSKSLLWQQSSTASRSTWTAMFSVLWALAFYRAWLIGQLAYEAVASYVRLWSWVLLVMAVWRGVRVVGWWLIFSLSHCLVLGLFSEQNGFSLCRCVPAFTTIGCPWDMLVCLFCSPNAPLVACGGHMMAAVFVATALLWWWYSYVTMVLIQPLGGIFEVGPYCFF